MAYRLQQSFVEHLLNCSMVRNRLHFFYSDSNIVQYTKLQIFSLIPILNPFVFLKIDIKSHIDFISSLKFFSAFQNISSNTAAKLTHSLLHHFETVPNSKKLQKITEMLLLTHYHAIPIFTH